MATQFQEVKVDTAPAKKWAAESLGSASTVYALSMPLLADPELYTEKKAKRFEQLLAETKSDVYKKDPAKQWMTSDEFGIA